LDDAVETTHEDLIGKTSSTWNAFTNSADLEIQDEDKHGTPIAGIIAALTDNAAGIKGVAPNVMLMAVRVIEWEKETTPSQYPPQELFPAGVVADGIETAACTADVLSMSLSFGPRKPWDPVRKDLEAAVDVALCRDGAATLTTRPNCPNPNTCQARVLAFPTGNGGTGNVVFPANLSSTRPVMAVGATDNQDIVKSFAGGWGSTYGAEVSVVAPGVDVVTIDRTSSAGYCDSGNYARFNGTSASTPIVAAVAALMQSQNRAEGKPLATPDEIRTRIEAGAVKLGPNDFDEHYGYGRVDACRSLRGAQCD
jgi:subtilisin family serine protease